MPASCASALVGNWPTTHGISSVIVRRKNGAAALVISARRSGLISAAPRVLSGASMVIRASMWSAANRSIGAISPTSSSGASLAQTSSRG